MPLLRSRPASGQCSEMKLLIAPVALLLASCYASKPVAPSVAVPAAAAQILDAEITTPATDRIRVTVVRDTGAVGASCPFLIYVDQTAAAALLPGNKIDLHLKPGDYILSLRHPPKGICKWGPVVQRDMTVKPDKPLRYRAGYYDSTYILEPSAL
jgi:hypothetical protein